MSNPLESLQDRGVLERRPDLGLPPELSPTAGLFEIRTDAPISEAAPRLEFTLVDASEYYARQARFNAESRLIDEMHGQTGPVRGTESGLARFGNSIVDLARSAWFRFSRSVGEQVFRKHYIEQELQALEVDNQAFEERVVSNAERPRSSDLERICMVQRYSNISSAAPGAAVSPISSESMAASSLEKMLSLFITGKVTLQELIDDKRALIQSLHKSDDSAASQKHPGCVLDNIVETAIQLRQEYLDLSKFTNNPNQQVAERANSALERLSRIKLSLRMAQAESFLQEEQQSSASERLGSWLGKQSGVFSVLAHPAVTIGCFAVAGFKLFSGSISSALGFAGAGVIFGTLAAFRAKNLYKREAAQKRLRAALGEASSDQGSLLVRLEDVHIDLGEKLERFYGALGRADEAARHGVESDSLEVISSLKSAFETVARYEARKQVSAEERIQLIGVESRHQLQATQLGVESLVGLIKRHPLWLELNCQERFQEELESEKRRLRDEVRELREREESASRKKLYVGLAVAGASLLGGALIRPLWAKLEESGVLDQLTRRMQTVFANLKLAPLKPQAEATQLPASSGSAISIPATLPASIPVDQAPAPLSLSEGFTRHFSPGLKKLETLLKFGGINRSGINSEGDYSFDVSELLKKARQLGPEGQAILDAQAHGKLVLALVPPGGDSADAVLAAVGADGSCVIDADSKIGRSMFSFAAGKLKNQGIVRLCVLEDPAVSASDHSLAFGRALQLAALPAR